MTSQIVMMVLSSNTNSVSLDELAQQANKIVIVLIPQSVSVAYSSKYKPLYILRILISSNECYQSKAKLPFHIKLLTTLLVYIT